MIFALMAEDRSRVLIPVKIAPCEMPTRLRARWWLDATRELFDAVIDQLARALTVAPPSGPTPGLRWHPQRANSILRRNRIHDSKEGGGVFVNEQGQGLMEDNDIFVNTLSGVAIQTGRAPTVRRNRIHKNGYGAIWV